MTPRQLELARHALGLPNERNRSYRNRYCASAGGGPHSEWLAMTKAGMARRDARFSASTELFTLTEAGAAAALLPGETLDPEDFPEAA